MGCKFDSWGEFFDFDKWMQAFAETGIEPDFYTSRVRSYDEILPWEHIDVGVTKEYFIKESEKAKAEITTPHCRLECSNCGANKFKTGVCTEKRGGASV